MKSTLFYLYKKWLTSHGWCCYVVRVTVWAPKGHGFHSWTCTWVSGLISVSVRGNQWICLLHTVFLSLSLCFFLLLSLLPLPLKINGKKIFQGWWTIATTKVIHKILLSTEVWLQLNHKIYRLHKNNCIFTLKMCLLKYLSLKYSDVCNLFFKIYCDIVDK